MSSVIRQRKSHLDWYEELCQRLDALQKDGVEFADENDILPPAILFKQVKEIAKGFRRLALATPDVWFGPDGQIGLTWDAGERSFDLIFGAKFTAHLMVGLKQKSVKPQDVPSILAQFAV